MFVLLVYCGDYFFFGIRFFGLMMTFFSLGIFGKLSFPMPERVEDPSMPTRISGEPILIDDDILFAVSVLTFLKHSVCECVCSLSDNLWFPSLLILS